MNLVQALKNTTYTQNGALTHKTTLNKCLDLFWQGPLVTDPNKLVKLWDDAYAESPETATKLAFWLRDPRGGSGSRFNGRLLTTMIEMERELLEMPTFLTSIVEYGRFDDLLFFLESKNANYVATWWMSQIYKGNKLAAKWAPRESGSNKKYARIIAKECGLDMKTYRKIISKASNTVEQLICSKKWNEIIFSHVPSQAMKRLRKAFKKHQEERFEKYQLEVANGNERINTSTLFPHQILGECINRNWVGWGPTSVVELDATMTNLWNNQPNWVADVPTLVVADTSGSMSGLPIQVSISLAMYTAERLPEPWKNNFITFSSKARFVYLDPSETIAKRIAKIPSIVENTNLQSVFDLVLKAAKANNLSQDDMPHQILIISDMQFDAAKEGTTNFQEIEKKYAQAGYRRPNLVFWNVNSCFDSTVPVTFDQNNTALISGYSSAILKSLSGGQMDPVSIMKTTIERYPSSF